MRAVSETTGRVSGQARPHRAVRAVLEVVGIVLKAAEASGLFEAA